MVHIAFGLCWCWYIGWKKNAEALVVARKDTGLAVNADKTKYMGMSRYQNVGCSHNIKIDISSFEMVELFKYLRRTLMNQKSIPEEIKSRWKSWNACYHLVQNLLSPTFLSKNKKIKVYRTIMLCVVMYGCETWSPTLREEYWLRVFENRCWWDYLGLRGTR